MPSRSDLLRIYADTRSIAVVGASMNEERPGHYIPRYLRSQGYRIVPVNPRGGEMFGEPVHRSLAEVADGIDVVEVFRPPEEAAGIARAAVAVGAKVLWFQPGTDSDEAVRIASEAGLQVVRGQCMGVTHRELGLGPGP